MKPEGVQKMAESVLSVIPVRERQSPRLWFLMSLVVLYWVLSVIDDSHLASGPGLRPKLCG
jgi:hypothetical protein